MPPILPPKMRKMDRPEKPLSLQQLAEKIRSLRKRKDQDAGRGYEAAAHSEVSHVISEVVLTPIAAMVIGFALDRWLQTTPVLMLVFLVLGIAVGFYNIARVQRNQDQDKN